MTEVENRSEGLKGHFVTIGRNQVHTLNFSGWNQGKNTLYLYFYVLWTGIFFLTFLHFWGLSFSINHCTWVCKVNIYPGGLEPAGLNRSFEFVIQLKKTLTALWSCPWKFWVKRWQETEKEFCKDELRLRPLRSKDIWTEINFRCELHFSLVRSVHSISISHLDAHSIPRSQSHWCTTNSWCTDASWVISGFWFCEI